MPHQFIIVIPTCEKNKNRLEAVQETWAKDLKENFKVIYVFARPGKKTELRGSELYLDCPESYEEGPRKVIEIYNFLIKNLTFDYLYKCDDDTYVNVQRLLELDLEGKDYIGNFATDKKTAIDPTAHYGKCTNKLLEVPYRGKFIVPWARGGRGYFLSKHATQELCKLVTNKDLEEIFEDKMVGEILSRAQNIKTLHLDKAQMPSLHPIQASEMYLIHGMHKANKELLKENPILKEKLLNLNTTLQEQKENNLLLKERNDALNIKNKTLLEDLSNFKSQKNEIAEKNERLKSELTSLKEGLNALRTEKDLLLERNKLLSKEKNELKEQVIQAKAKKGELIEINKQLKVEEASLKEELKRLKTEKNLLLERNNLLSKEKNELKEQVSQGKAKKSELTEISKQLKSEGISFKEELKQLKTEKNLLVERNNLLNKEKADLKNRAQQLKEQKNSFLEKNKKLVGKIENLESELRQIKQSKLYRLGKSIRRTNK